MQAHAAGSTAWACTSTPLGPTQAPKKTGPNSLVSREGGMLQILVPWMWAIGEIFDSEVSAAVAMKSGWKLLCTR